MANTSHFFQYLYLNNNYKEIVLCDYCVLIQSFAVKD